MLAIVVVAGCTSPADQRGGGDFGGGTTPTPVPAVTGVSLTEVATGLSQPLLVTHAGDGSGRLFIVEQTGTVRVFRDGRLLADPFLDITNLVLSGGERGLLGLAFAPDYEKSGRFYVSYTAKAGEGDSILARYKVQAADADRAAPSSAEILLTVDQPFANHNGGNIVFGPDGYLYFGLGDGGSGGDPAGNGQNTLTLLGSLLRLDVSGATGYSVPPTNPFVGRPTAKPEIWAFGLRNPWRFSFDRTTGDLYMADVGQNSWEEVNFQPAASKGGENYGWNFYEGNHAHRPGIPDGKTFPIAEYATADPNCSVTGGHVYRGPTVTPLSGLYVFADYCSGKIWTLERSGATWEIAELMDTEHQISSFGEDEEGEVYATHHGGIVYKFSPVLADS